MADWQKRKRLEAVINGEVADRLPVALWRHWPGDDQEPEALAVAHLKWQSDYDWDLVKVSPPSSFCLVDWGVEDRWEGHPEGTRTYTRRAIQQVEDWLELTVLKSDTGMLGDQIEALRLVGQALGEETPFIATIFSPLAQAKNLAGGEKMLTHMRKAPQLFLEGLNIIKKSTLAYIEAAKETGISGIYYAIQHARYSLLSPSEYRLFGEPLDEEILTAASDLWLNVVHLHGDADIMLDLVADYPIQIMNWHDRDSGVSLAEGHRQISGAVSGGVSRWTMQRENPTAVVAEAEDAVEQMDGRGLLLGTGCVIMTNTPQRNIKTLREFVDRPD